MTVINPGYFATGFVGAMPMAAVEPAHHAMRDQVLSGFGAMAPGNPDEVVEVILNAARGLDAPCRHAVGKDARGWTRGSLKARLLAVGV
ncbi:MAG: hypothetical protein INF93_18135 [Rhodobacter sp.]|nr:hypothetical protein [Rhodobacter sp.]